MQGNRQCDLNKPNVMDIVGNNIFVTDRDGVAVYDTDGCFIARFAQMCANANGIIVDVDGFVYISDSQRNRIVVF